MSAIVVYLEAKDEKLMKGSLEAMGIAKDLAEKLGLSIHGVLSNKIQDSVKAQAEKLPLTDLYYFDDNDNYSLYRHAKAIVTVAKQFENPYVIIAGTTHGRELAAKVAIDLDAGYMSDIVGYEVVDNEVLYTRAIYGNKILLKLKLLTPIKVMSTRIGGFDAVDSEGAPEVKTITVEPDELEAKAVLKEIKKSESKMVDLTEAEYIVSGGRGVGGPENWHLIIDLAKLLNAATGASRVVTDAGWRPHSEQVGQTGKYVSPKLYIAIGISGAIQHVAGIMNSDVIVAINKDPEAPIFRVADYGIVADLFDAVPKLIEELKKYKEQA